MIRPRAAIQLTYLNAASEGAEMTLMLRKRCIIAQKHENAFQNDLFSQKSRGPGLTKKLLFFDKTRLRKPVPREVLSTGDLA